MQPQNGAGLQGNDVASGRVRNSCRREPSRTGSVLAGVAVVWGKHLAGMGLATELEGTVCDGSAAGLRAGRRGWTTPPQGVPSMGRILLDERSQSGPMTATVAEPQGATARGKPKEAEGKLSTAGIRTGSEAGCGRQAGPEQRSPKVIKTHHVEPGGAREQILHLTWGDLFRESGGEVSRGRSSEEAA